MPVPIHAKEARAGDVLLLGPGPTPVRVTGHAITPDGYGIFYEALDGTQKPGALWTEPDHFVALANRQEDVVRPPVPVMIGHALFWALQAGIFGYLLIHAEPGFYPMAFYVAAFAITSMLVGTVILDIDKALHGHQHTQE